MQAVHQMESAFSRITALAGVEEAPEPLETERYLEVALPLDQRCSLTLLPLRSEDFSELPPTVECSGTRFHALAINFWIRNVQPEPPSF